MVFFRLLVLDVVGTGSLSFDWPIFGPMRRGKGGGMEADRSNNLIRSASILRFTHFARVFRVLRLVRVDPDFSMSRSSLRRRRRR